MGGAVIGTLIGAAFLKPGQSIRSFTPQPTWTNVAKHYEGKTYLSQFDSSAATNRVKNGIYIVESVGIVETENGPTFYFSIKPQDPSSTNSNNQLIWGPSGFTYDWGFQPKDRILVTNGTIKNYQTPEEIEAYNKALKEQFEEDKREEEARNRK